METRKPLSTIVLIGIALAMAPCQLKSQEKILEGISFAQFRYDSASAYVEIYASIVPSRLRFLPVRNDSAGAPACYVSFAAIAYRITNDVSDSSFMVVDTIPVSVADTSGIDTAADVVAISRLLLEPARYSVVATVTNRFEKGKGDTLAFEIAVRSFPETRLSVSDIELCSSVRSAPQSDDPYYKNMARVIPNPRALYGLGLPVISSYLEIYGLSRRADSTSYRMTWKVIDTYGNVVKESTILKAGRSSAVVEIGAENVSDLPSGKYALVAEVGDSVSKASARTSQYFFVYNPYVKQPSLTAGKNVNVIASPFFSKGEEELDAIFHAAMYLARSEQAEIYKKLTTVDAKRRFLAEFWSEQDRKAAAGGLNSWQEFEKRFEFVNRKYKVAFRAGWLTDRGRVYIEYGNPDDIDRHSSSANSKPYEVWTYNSIQGGVIFVFADLTGFNNYVLIHSTKHGEVDDPDWKKYVQIDQR